MRVIRGSATASSPIRARARWAAAAILFGLVKDGTEVPIEIGLNPLSTPDGAFVLSSIVDITERKRAAGQIEASLREKETLLKEVHHGVKNNLQVISSLINMQVRQVADASARDALEECQSRLQAIGLIHEKLYQFEYYSRVPFSEYVRSLAATIFQATGIAPSAVALDLQIEMRSACSWCRRWSSSSKGASRSPAKRRARSFASRSPPRSTHERARSAVDPRRRG